MKILVSVAGKPQSLVDGEKITVTHNVEVAITGSTITLSRRFTVTQFLREKAKDSDEGVYRELCVFPHCSTVKFLSAGVRVEFDINGTFLTAESVE